MGYTITQLNREHKINTRKINIKGIRLFQKKQNIIHKYKFTYHTLVNFINKNFHKCPWLWLSGSQLTHPNKN